MEKTNAFLLATLRDKISQCLAGDNMTTSAFLDFHQRTIAQQFCQRQSDVQFCFWGGYSEAERTLACFFPKYWGLKTAKDAIAWLQEDKAETPIVLLQAIYQGENSLGHRDYLGALMNLGIERNVLGDILVHSDGAQVLVLRKIAPYLLQNWQRVGKAKIVLQEKRLDHLVLPQNQIQEKWDTVASCRLDNVLAAAFNTSRKAATEAIQNGLIFVNGLERWKADSLVQVGDRLVWRGKGKVILQQIGERTKKGRFPIVMQKYGS